MAWVKIPADNHPVFLAALPKDPRVSTLKMFGGLAGIVNGHMFGGLFGRSFMVKLSEADQEAALELDGAEPFDPMGTGAVMKDSIFMPEPVLDEASELRDWLRRAFQYTAMLPPKVKKAKAAKPAKAKLAKPKPAKAKSKPAAGPKKKPAPRRSKR
jgi:TfoX/Sxy family transcriptional regulator of competence genes